MTLLAPVRFVIAQLHCQSRHPVCWRCCRPSHAQYTSFALAACATAESHCPVIPSNKEITMSACGLFGSSRSTASTSEPKVPTRINPAAVITPARPQSPGEPIASSASLSRVRAATVGAKSAPNSSARRCAIAAWPGLMRELAVRPASVMATSLAVPPQSSATKPTDACFALAMTVDRSRPEPMARLSTSRFWLRHPLQPIRVMMDMLRLECTHAVEPCLLPEQRIGRMALRTIRLFNA